MKRKKPKKESRQAHTIAGTSRRRRWLMRLASATIVPLLFFLALEVGLRVGGYGYPTSYLRPSKIDGRDFLIPNEKFSYRFFPPALARAPMLLRMATPKPAGTYRIFLFGESAAYGDPDPSYGVGRYLEALLEERYASTDFEVICVAMTAINSHAILPIARECVGYDGDLWVFYMGNNEMVGPFGAGTVFGTRAPRLGMVRAILAVRTTRVGQLLDALVRGLRSDSSVPQEWGGIDMFSKYQLRHDDAGRLRAYDNFKGNLEAILQAGQQADVPIILSTVASNLKDCAPFASLHASGLDATQLAKWDKFYQDGRALEKAGSYQAAVDVYANAAAIDSEFAELQFRIGTCYLALGHTEEARRAFELARDYDALGFRADTRINTTLSGGFEGKAFENLVRVDAAEILADQSPDGIPGEELCYEHVHHTLAGNYRLARILSDHVAELLPASITAQGSESWAEAKACDRRLAVTVWDRQRLWREMLRRISVAPFTSQSSHGNNKRYCEDRLQTIISSINQETPVQDRRMYAEALAQAPEDNLLRANHAQFLETTTSRSKAITEAERVCELLPGLSWPCHYVGLLLVREGRISEAAGYFRRALAIRSDFAQARKELERIQASHPHAVGLGR